LEKIMDDAEQKGLLFIADADARAPGGAHPAAHLWDNGADAIAELKEVIRVREKALQQFGRNNIRPGFPMAMLEDVLVPVYFYHRYQVEAACKLVGGVDYNYALNGKIMKPVRPLLPAVQSAALDAVIRTLQPGFLEMPSNIIQLIPPRPAGYSYGNELFRKHTGLVFDPLAPAETAADLPLSFLYHPDRISRLAIDTGFSLAAMNKKLLDATFRAPRLRGMQGMIQQQTEQVLLTYLLAASQDERASFAARAAMRKTLNDLKQFVESGKAGSGEQLAGHYALVLERMKAPEKAKPSQHASIPPGAPIGCME
jgi:hypothetical protein